MAFVQVRFFSEALGKQTECFVLLPEAPIPKPWHVMFLLHGHSDDHSIWQRRTSIERYVEGLPLVVVMPDAAKSFYCDGVQGPAYNRAIAYELPDLVERWFSPGGEWCASGLSMGGYGAFRIALERPELFKSAVSHSGAVGFAHQLEYFAENRNSEEFRRIVGDARTGGPNDLFELVKATSPLPSLRFDCGTEDFLLQDNRLFRDYLVESGIPHEYEEFPGSHNWAYWDLHVQDAIAFHRKNLGF
ncbi:MAG: alpha/beta hydrolase [Fimbriimonas sp.]